MEALIGRLNYGSIRHRHRAFHSSGCSAGLRSAKSDAGSRIAAAGVSAGRVMDGGPYSPVYEWLAETVRSLLPRMEALGITNAEAFDSDTMRQRLRDEAVAMQGVVIARAIIGAFARKPA